MLTVSMVWISTVFAFQANNLDVWEVRHFDEKIILSAIATPTPTPTPTATPMSAGVRAVAEAEKYLGVPYVWGGTTPEGFDCSGLVQYAYQQIGIQISRTSYTQINDGYEVQKDELKAGDLVFFANKRQGVHHVAMYIGNGNIIHAPYTGDVVKIIPLSSRDDYYSARRIVD